MEVIESSLTCLLISFGSLLSPSLQDIIPKNVSDHSPAEKTLTRSLFKCFPHCPKYVVHTPHTTLFLSSESTISFLHTFHIFLSLLGHNSYSPSSTAYPTKPPRCSHLCNHCIQFITSII